MAIFQPLWWGIACIAEKKYPDSYSQRLGKATLKRPENTPLIWFHAASVGEALLTLNLCDALQDRVPNVQILITVQTQTAIEVLRRKAPHVLVQKVPYDSPRYVQRFLAHWRPDVFCALESEMWPCLWEKTYQWFQKRSRAMPMLPVPMYLFHFHMSERSQRIWRFFPSFVKKQYALFFQRWTGCRASYQRFVGLTGLSMILTPSLRYMTAVRPTPPICLPPQRQYCWLASCIHPGEEELILNTHARLREQFPDLMLIIAPRHIERTAFMLKSADQRGWSACTYTEPRSESEVYVIDMMGILDAFYKAHTFVVMGGSFINKGGHNVAEPILLDCAVIQGHSIAHNPDMAFLLSTHNAMILTQPEALASHVEHFLRNPQEAIAMSHRARMIIEQKRRELERYVQDWAEQVAEHFPS